MRSSWNRIAAKGKPGVPATAISTSSSAGSGIDLARELAGANSALRIVLVSTMEERDLPSNAKDAGMIGFVEKSRLGPELVHQLTQRSLTD